MKRPLTLHDYTAAMDAFPATLPPGYPITVERRDLGEAACYVLYSDGVEVGRIDVTPRPAWEPGEAKLSVAATALTRGRKASMLSHGDMQHIPERDQRLFALYQDVLKRWNTHMELWLGTGQWAFVWDHVQGEAEAEPQANPQPSGGYLFRKCGDYWELAFGEAPFLLRDLRGLAYLRILLSHPSEDITPEDVEAMADGEHPRRLEDPDRPLSDWGTKAKGKSEQVQDGLDTESLHITDYDRDDEDTLTDAQGIKAVRAELARIEEEIANADPFFGVPDGLIAEKEKLEHYLSSVVGKRDSLRIFEGADDAARKRVGKAVKDAIEAIRAKDAAMGAHLDTAIETPSGYRSRYAPKDPVDWTLE